MHYNNLIDAQETANIFKSEPIICKLADLGEARSKLLQAKVINNNSCTHFVRRGSKGSCGNFGWGVNSKISRNWTIESHRCVGTYHDFFR